jgi:hypothetical protein
MSVIRRLPIRSALALAAAVLGAAAVSGRQAPPVPSTPAWVSRSNAHTRVVLQEQARIAPEGMAQLGVDGLDDQITDLSAGYIGRVRASALKIEAELKKRLAAESDALVRQDLEILLEANARQLRAIDTAEKRLLPYVNAPQAVFGALRALLDDQIAPERRRAAVVRLRKYAGADPGVTPFTELALERVREKLAQKELLGPFKDQVERDLGNIGFFAKGLEDLYTKYDLIAEAAPLLERLKTQFTAYERAVRAEILPRARTDFVLPADLYANSLDQFGVDIPPADLAALAHRAFDEIQKEMQTIATAIAKEQGSATTDYRAVIRQLKTKQLVGDAILPHYQARLKQLEAIIRERDLVRLPDRPARIRIASAAESAQQPAPNMRPPRLVDNRGEQGEFVLPLNIPSADGKAKQYDDFTFEAASWTLTAHEARPGHEMQFAAMVEHGVSQARAIYAFNSTNVEGWGLYAEYIVKPFMPREGQLISLQHRLLRAARAFSDPELQMGRTTPEKVKQLLMTDVVLSDAMATQEVERYTFRAPGQATSYFYGYSQLLALRQDVEKALGAKFSARQFHDFVLSQGLLPPRLLRRAVMEGLAKP